MTVIGSSADGSRRPAPGVVAVAAIVVLTLFVTTRASAEDAVLNLRAKVLPVASGGALTIDVFRWSTDAERAPLVAALATPPTVPRPSPAAGRAAGRGGRGGRGAAPPPSPAEQMAKAVKAAPTLGYIWGEGVTGYSIKYAWRSPSTDRIVLVTDRRLGEHAPEWNLTLPAGPEPEFTVIELHLDGTGTGEGKSSLSTGVVVDAAASTVALDRFAAAPALLKVSR
jgi:hypothetical protein